MDQDLDLAVNLATVMLSQQATHPTETSIRQVAAQVIDGMLPNLKERIEDVVRQLECRYNVRIGISTELVDKSHKLWLPTRKSEINWRYWNRYKAYLANAKRLPPSVVDGVEESVDRILVGQRQVTSAVVWGRRF